MRSCEYKMCIMPVFATDKNTRKGYCKSHQFARTDTDKRSAIQKHLDKNKEPTKYLQSVIDRRFADELERWFEDRRFEGNGYCDCGCGNEVSTDDKYYKHSLAHVLPKSKFISIATHPENCLHLAFWGGCHTTLDDMGYEYCKEKKPFLWHLIVSKFLILYPCIAPEEIKFIPDVLLAEL